MAADNTNTAQYSNALAPCSNNGLVAIWSTLTKAEAFEANDTLTMCKIPQGMKVVAYFFHIDKKVGDSGAVTIGTMSDSTAIDADSIQSTIAATAAAFSAGPSLLPISYGAEANGRVVVTITGLGANPTTDATIRLCVICSPLTV